MGLHWDSSLGSEGGGSADHTTQDPELQDSYCHNWIVTTRLNCCRQRPAHGTDRGDTRHRTRSNSQQPFLG